MKDTIDTSFGQNLRFGRRQLELTQLQLAKRINATRTHIVKLESGANQPKWQEVVQLAAVLQVPLQWFVTGHRRPPIGIKGLIHELRHYGIRDLTDVDHAPIPGIFRRVEEVLVLAVRGNEPQVRIVEAIPVILAKHPIDVDLVIAFAKRFDRRAKVRLAWLAAVAELLAKKNDLVIADACIAGLESIQEQIKPSKQIDAIGFPTQKNVPPAWKRWNINYAGTLESFASRILEIKNA